MDKRASGQGFDEISHLIRSEKEAALAAFRSGDFRSRVRRRWRETGESAPASKVRPAAVAAAAAAMLVVAAAFIFLVRQPPGTGRRPGFQTLASVLGALPGGVTLSREETMAPAASDLTVPAALAVSLRSVLVVAQGTVRGERTPESVSGRAAPVTRTSLFRKMEILFRDRVIERTFLSLRDPSKEV